jgi:hypothetical protein
VAVAVAIPIGDEETHGKGRLVLNHYHVKTDPDRGGEYVNVGVAAHHHDRVPPSRPCPTITTVYIVGG